MTKIQNIYDFALSAAYRLQGVVNGVQYDEQDFATRVTAVCCVESGSYKKPTTCNEHATGGAGERGVMQIKPSTAKWISEKFGQQYRNDDALYTPEYCVFIGSLYLLYQYDRYGNDWDKAYHAYNQGSYRPNAANAFTKGQEYVRRVNIGLDNIHKQNLVGTGGGVTLAKAGGLILAIGAGILFYNKIWAK